MSLRHGNGVILRERYETLKLNDLREIAKKRGIKGATALKKSEIIDIMCELDEKENAQKQEQVKEAEKEPEKAAEKEDRPKTAHKKKNIVVAGGNAKPAPRTPAGNAEEKKPVRPEKAEKTSEAPQENEEVADGDDANGILEVMQDGYGFIRCENYLPGENDVYVAPSLIRKFNLKTGDILKGKCRAKKETDKFAALLVLDSVNGYKPEVAMGRWNFENMTPIFPNSRIKLEQPGSSVAMRIMDLISPIGKGQRGMIVSPPKAGKTILLQKVANSITANNPNCVLIVLLIDERPEEVTDMQRNIKGEVVYSTFDKRPENHVRVTELVLERAMRLVEIGKDVVILLDSMTRLARAYNLTINPTGRTLSGGLDPGSLYGPKRFFGAARNIEDGGSLTILATALIETGSRMDEVIFEEFKGTGNMEVTLDRKLADRRIFPAIAVDKSGTRREDLLLEPEELDAVWLIRRRIAEADTATATNAVISFMEKTSNNRSFIYSVKKSFAAD